MILSSMWLLPGPAGAAIPIDHRGLGPNHPSELPGAGYLLTDPYQGGSRAYWAGAYRSVPGQRSYCIDDYYDYPDPRYGYQTSEAAGWLGRPGSNLGAQGHVAEQIAWIVNRYGNSASPAVDAEVSMSINLLMGSAPFNRSYYGFFKPQLDAINAGIVPAINQMISQSDRFAGPYRTELKMGPAPGVGGIGSFVVLVRSARGIAVPGATIALDPSPSMKLQGRTTVRTGASGVAELRYIAMGPGPLTVAAAGQAMPNTTIRLGYSPTHNSNNFSTGSQRVALISAHSLVPVRRVVGRAGVVTPLLHTTVDGGSVGRHPGDLVSDHVVASGLAKLTAYRLVITLQDASGLVCSSRTMIVRADARGRLDLHTATLPVCGGGTDTFAERLSLGPITVGSSPPGQPSETFPVTPRITTIVVGGSRTRVVGTEVADQVAASGLPAGPVHVLAVLLDDTGRTCAHVSVPATADRKGELSLTTPALKVCGQTRNTFVEQILDRTGVVLVASEPWLPAETYPVSPPPATTPPSPPASSTPPTSSSPPSKPAPPSHAAPPSQPAQPGPPPAASPPPHLAMTGSGSRLALAGGLLSFAIGGLLLIASRRT